MRWNFGFYIAVGIEVGVAGPVLDLMDQGLIAPH